MAAHAAACRTTRLESTPVPMDLYILNSAGEPVAEPDALRWAEWFEATQTDGTRVVAHDRDERPGAPSVLVSTVFLGIDHNFGSGPPVLWETMILGGIHDGYQMRYASVAAAIEGHRVACALMNETAG